MRLAVPMQILFRTFTQERELNDEQARESEIEDAEEEPNDSPNLSDTDTEAQSA